MILPLSIACAILLSVIWAYAFTSLSQYLAFWTTFVFLCFVYLLVLNIKIYQQVQQQIRLVASMERTDQTYPAQVVLAEALAFNFNRFGNQYKQVLSLE